MISYHPIVLPMKVDSTIILDPIGDYQQADLIAYPRLIGKLMYLSYETRPDCNAVARALAYGTHVVPCSPT